MFGEKAGDNALMERNGMASVRTPDQRLRVFVSSTLQELAAERAAVRQVISQLRLIPVFFESGARPHPPRKLYRAYLEQSHIFIGIYWQRYGWVAPDMDISGLEDEYHLSENMPRLIYIKAPAQEREEGLTELLALIRRDGTLSYKQFSTAEELSELVANDLALLLSERYESSMLAQTVDGRQAGRPQTNLPLELSPFIGREQQITSVLDLLGQESVRLLTLTGTGGVGKTRLALKTGSRLLNQFRDGVWLVELAALSNPTLIPQLVATVLTVRENRERSLVESVLDYLRSRSLLLILDNCEHLIDEVAQFTETVLKTVPDVKVLATSREPLRATGEIVWSIPPLSAPALSEEAAPADLLQYEAVNLFVDRATAVRPDFRLTDRNAVAVAQICARLDGVPLAIELAAAQVRILPVEEIIARLDDRFRLLVGTRTAADRQRSLCALIDWSHGLLKEKERILFRRLSVFSGGWTLSAAEQVCSGDGIEASELLDLLTQLIDKSLVLAKVQDDTERYSFLETMRQYAQKRLEESEEKEKLACKHARYFLNMAEVSYGAMWGPKQRDCLGRLEAEHDNLRAALEWQLQGTGREEMLLRMAGSLWRFWEIRGHITEGRTWLDLALERNKDGPAYLRANGLRGAGMLACQHGDYAQAKRLHEQSLELFQELGNKLGIARQLDILGEIEQFQGNYQKAMALHKESLGLHREIGDTEGVAASLGQLGAIARDQGRYQQSRELLEESLRLNWELGDKLLVARTLNNLGLLADCQTDYGRAIPIFEEAISLYRELNDKHGISNTLWNLGNVAKDQGDFGRALNLYRESLQLEQELGDRQGSALTIASLAETAFFKGNYPLAANLAERSLTQFKELGVKKGIFISMLVRAYVAVFQGDHELAFLLASKGIAMTTELDAPRPTAYAHMIFGLNAYGQGKSEEATEQFHEALTAFRKADDKRNIANALVCLARAAYRRGEYANATSFLDESLVLSRKLDSRWSLAYSYEIMGLVQRSEGNCDQALELFQESLRLSIRQGNLQGIANCLGALAGLAVMNEQPIPAAHLFAAAEKVRKSVGARMGNGDRREYEQYLAEVRKQLDETEFGVAWSAGMAMTTGQAVEEAFELRLVTPAYLFEETVREATHHYEWE